MLGARQARLLIRAGWWDLVAAALVAALLAGILVGVAAKPLKPVQWILASVLAAAAMATGVVYFRRVRAAAAEGRVECLTGPVQTRMQGKSGWYLDVAGRSFKLPVRPWNVKSGQPYRVYIAPKASRIVAMEPDG